jgi:hypothetical protein
VSELPTAFDVETLNVYLRPFVKEFAKVHANGVGNGTFKVQLKDGLMQQCLLVLKVYRLVLQQQMAWNWQSFPLNSEQPP